MCQRSKIGVYTKIVIALFLVANTILQFVGLLKPWGCKLGLHDSCEEEGLFNYCWNGTCTARVRFNGLATLATTSFTFNLICDAICLILIWRSYNIFEDLARALIETFSGWLIWWKWIAIFSTLSNTTAGLTFILGLWQYNRAAVGLYLFSIPGTIFSGVLSFWVALYLVYCVGQFDDYFLLSD